MTPYNRFSGYNFPPRFNVVRCADGLVRVYAPWNPRYSVTEPAIHFATAAERAWRFYESSTALPRRWALPLSRARLAYLNDNRHPFAEIAEYMEKTF